MEHPWPKAVFLSSKQQGRTVVFLRALLMSFSEASSWPRLTSNPVMRPGAELGWDPAHPS